MEDFARALADFVRDHQAWAAPIVLLLAFGESLRNLDFLQLDREGPVQQIAARDDGMNRRHSDWSLRKK